MSSLQRQVTELQDALAQATERPEELEADTERDRAAPSAVVPVSGSCPVAVRAQPVPTVDQTAVGQGPSRMGARGRGLRRQSKDTDACHICGQLGHCAKECTKRASKPTVKGIDCPRVAPTHVYVDVLFENKPIRCPLDRGMTEVSLVNSLCRM